MLIVYNDYFSRQRQITEISIVSFLSQILFGLWDFVDSLIWLHLMSVLRVCELFYYLAIDEW